MREELAIGGAVKDVAWRPNLGIPSSSVALCFEDGLIQIWTQDMEGQPWTPQVSWTVSAVSGTRLTWSKAGCMLAVSHSDRYQLFKEGLVSQWTEVCNE
eukprot:Skav216122  [mRNA]  locus=scaffold1946:236820:237116:+ [translate_table: standard]